MDAPMATTSPPATVEMPIPTAGCPFQRMIASGGSRGARRMAATSLSRIIRLFSPPGISWSASAETSAKSPLIRKRTSPGPTATFPASATLFCPSMVSKMSAGAMPRRTSRARSISKYMTSVGSPQKSMRPTSVHSSSSRRRSVATSLRSCCVYPSPVSANSTP